MNIKEIAFVGEKMDIGGVEKNALLFLQLLNKEKYNVDFLYHLERNEKEGLFFQYIPKWVQTRKVIILNKFNYKEYCIRWHQKMIFWWRYIKLYCCRNASIDKYQSMYIKLGMPEKKNYDIAIVSVGQLGIFYAIHNIRAKRKILWVHWDVQAYDATSKIIERYYNAYDLIIVVSEAAKNILVETFPKLGNKVSVVYNYINWKEIRRLAAYSCTTPFDGYEGVKITTVGRLSYEKGMIMAAKCCKLLRDNGIDVKWVLCGDGAEKENIKEYLRDNQLEDSFVLVGNQLNPYPFIDKCDIYVQPSLQEAFCTTTNEAKVLCKPIVATDVCGMREQIKHMVTGILVDPNVEALYDGICILLKEPQLMQEIKKELSSLDWQCQVDYNELLDSFFE